MLKGEFRFKKGIGEYGYYGHVQLEIEESDTHQIHFTDRYTDNNNYSAFDIGIIFGVNYALAEYRKIKNGHKLFKITIVKHHEFPVDSTPTVLAFVAAKAVFNAFNIDQEIKYPLILGEQGEFVFRK